MPRFVRELVEELHEQRPWLSQATLALGALLAADAASLALLELVDRLGVDPAFE